MKRPLMWALAGLVAFGVGWTAGVILLFGYVHGRLID